MPSLYLNIICSASPLILTLCRQLDHQFTILDNRFTKIKLEYSILITFQVLKLLQINLDSFYNNVLIWGLLSAHSSLVSTPLDDEMEKK